MLASTDENAALLAHDVVVSWSSEGVASLSSSKSISLATSCLPFLPFRYKNSFTVSLL